MLVACVAAAVFRGLGRNSNKPGHVGGETNPDQTMFLDARCLACIVSTAPQQNAMKALVLTMHHLQRP